MTPIFRWNGQYVGFVSGEFFFDFNGRYVGWLDNDMVWNADGTFLGEIVEQHHIMRNLRMAPPVRRAAKVPPVVPVMPQPPPNRNPKQPKPGWLDMLESLGRMPAPEELAGAWQGGEETLSFTAGGEFNLTVDSGARLSGNWELRGQLLLIKYDDPTDDKTYIYRILEYKTDHLLLRQQSLDQRTLPIALTRRRTVE